MALLQIMSIAGVTDTRMPVRLTARQNASPHIAFTPRSAPLPPHCNHILHCSTVQLTMAPLRRATASRPRAGPRNSPRVTIKHARTSQKRDLSKTSPMTLASKNRADRFKIFLHDDHPLLSFRTPNFPVTIELCRSSRSKVADGRPFLNDCLELIEYTSGDDYRASRTGWHPKEKLKEMQDSSMLYLLVRRAETDTSDTAVQAPDTQKILGFLSFMYTNDDPPHTDREVVYIYEVHLLDELRGGGLGSHLISIAEEAARQMGISKTMLTVFSRNQKARKLYEKLGYKKDACSPADREIRGRIIEADYIIMGKELN